jgi:hypothetical protein
MSESDLNRIIRLETNDAYMSQQIHDIKTDIKEIKEDIGQLKVAFAKWSTGIIVAVSTIQFLIQYIIK